MQIRLFPKALAVGVVAVSLAGCVSLFPKGKPTQLYRFGGEAPPAAASVGAVSLMRGPIGFPRAAAGDRLLTVTGSEAAYVADARWLSPAELMFGDALERAFDARAGGPKLVDRSDMTPAAQILRIDVDTFETRYLNGPETAPTVVVSFSASIVRAKDRQVMGQKIFSASKPAVSNRVGAIVDAYDAAVRETFGQLVDWSAGTAG